MSFQGLFVFKNCYKEILLQKQLPSNLCNKSQGSRFITMFPKCFIVQSIIEPFFELSAIASNNLAFVLSCE